MWHSEPRPTRAANGTGRTFCKEHPYTTHEPTRYSHFAAGGFVFVDRCTGHGA